MGGTGVVEPAELSSVVMLMAAVASNEQPDQGMSRRTSPTPSSICMWRVVPFVKETSSNRITLTPVPAGAMLNPLASMYDRSRWLTSICPSSNVIVKVPAPPARVMADPRVGDVSAPWGVAVLEVKRIVVDGWIWSVWPLSLSPPLVTWSDVPAPRPVPTVMVSSSTRTPVLELA